MLENGSGSYREHLAHGKSFFKVLLYGLKDPIHYRFEQQDQEYTSDDTDKKLFEGKMFEAVLKTQQHIKQDHGNQELYPVVHAFYPHLENSGWVIESNPCV